MYKENTTRPVAESLPTKHKTLNLINNIKKNGGEGDNEQKKIEYSLFTTTRERNLDINIKRSTIT